jgi:hypothetical protein
MLLLPTHVYLCSTDKTFRPAPTTFQLQTTSKFLNLYGQNGM